MTDASVTIRENPGRFREIPLIENALAKIVRRRWPSNTVENVAAEWGLTHGRARNVVYAHTSMASLNLIVRHKRGGWPIIIAIFETVIKTSLRDYVSQEVRGLNETLRRAQREADALAKLESDLCELSDLGVDRFATDRVRRSPASPSTPRRDDRQAMGRDGASESNGA